MAVPSGVLTRAIVAGAGTLLWWRYSEALAVTAATVTAQPATAGCNTTVDVVGTISTDGRIGLLRYQWQRNDGKASDVIAVKIGAGTCSVDMGLKVVVPRPGEFAATARLVVVSPNALESAGTFVYRCT